VSGAGACAGDPLFAHQYSVVNTEFRCLSPLAIMALNVAFVPLLEKRCDPYAGFTFGSLRYRFRQFSRFATKASRCHE